MPNIDVKMNNRIFKVSCDVGQEQRLEELSQWADERLQLIAGEVGQVGDTRLMLLTLLMTCDELFEMREKLDRLEKSPNGKHAQTEEGAAQIIEAATKRVNNLNELLGQ